MSAKSIKSLDSYLRRKSRTRSRSKTDINPKSVRSEIIICIFAHGMDLCNSELPKYRGRLENNTLVFTMADKNKSSVIGSPKTHASKYTFDILKSLYHRLHLERQLVHDVVRDLEQVESGRQLNTLQMIRQRIVDSKSTDEEYAKKIQSLVHTCEKNTVAKPRVLTIDRKYNTLNVKGGLGGIHILDIRNARTSSQNNAEEIQRLFEKDSEIKISDILNICYNQLHFNYVTIFDFACRDSAYKDTCENGDCCVCKTCIESAKEIEDGKRMMKIFKVMQLGGKLKRKTQKRIKRK